MIREVFNMSLKNINSNKMRSALSILGIMIGIASIIALLTIGQGVSTSVTEQLSGLGGNYITVNITSAAAKRSFTAGDIEEVSKINHVQGVSPSLHKYATATTYSEKSTKTGGYTIKAVYVSGTSHHYFESQKENFVAAGVGIRDFDVECSNTVCVLGREISAEMFGNKNPVGEIVLLNQCEFTVIGVLSDQGAISWGVSINEQILVPYTTAINNNALKMGDVKRLEILVDSADNVDAVYDNVNALMLTYFNGNKAYFKIVNQQAVMDIVVTISDLILGMLGGIAAISLLVGGIGIMNMMLVSVRERTSEIGLRKALGAKPKYIMLQFMFEAILISLIGGIVGIGVGIALAYVGTQLIGAAFALKAWTVLLATSFSIAVGLLFGIMPARKAAKLNPIDALRSS
jgi:ABC-type antimicrobial peptide transport system, permease component